MVTGIVQSVLPYGAFVDLGGVTGLLHVSQISHARVDNLTKILSEGDKLKVGGWYKLSLGSGSEGSFLHDGQSSQRGHDHQTGVCVPVGAWVQALTRGRALAQGMEAQSDCQRDDLSSKGGFVCWSTWAECSKHKVPSTSSTSGACPTVLSLHHLHQVQLADAILQMSTTSDGVHGVSALCASCVPTLFSFP